MTPRQAVAVFDLFLILHKCLLNLFATSKYFSQFITALTQSVECGTFNPKVKGSNPLCGNGWRKEKKCSVAQGKRVGPITQRTVDRNHSEQIEKKTW